MHKVVIVSKNLSAERKPDWKFNSFENEHDL